MSIFNLSHPDFERLAQLWLESPKCGRNLYSSTLTLSSDMVTVLNLSASGFVEPRLVKFQAEDNDAVITTLATTADSVCYRFYPRCEIIP
jgi:hypothetical protein